ncbi:MerR family transcriptional regulator [Paenisporosarcina sp.]|uniref:MerR family transcriptional regulator n=1 Tax=Paenisporosarcina sp. TaxID=1932001 RepID=UPI003C76AE78
MKSIAEVADEFNVTTRTIRYYEELGLLTPGRTESNIRFFGPAEHAKLKLIVRGKQYGFKLDEIKEMVLLFDHDRTGIKQLERTIEYGKNRVAEIEVKIRELEEMKSEMNSLLHIFDEKMSNLKGNGI